MNAPPLLQFSGIGRSFPSGDAEVAVLKDIDLDIAAGEFVAIMGASGSGKSTLMNLIGCLDRQSCGSYRLEGREVGALGNDELAALRREKFGFIFQRYHLLPHLDATGNVEMPAIYDGVPAAERHRRAEALLLRLGLAERTHHRPHQLSGGQQQRVSIARALMNGGQIILADEPTGALDTHSGQEVMAILRELNERGHTIILVTHDTNVAAHAHRIIEISDGEIVADRINARFSVEVAEVAGVAEVPESPQQQAPLPPVHPRGKPNPLTLYLEAFKMAWIALVSNRMRTLLTMLGIIIGITSVVSIVAIGEGARRYVLKDIQEIGTSTIEIFRGRDFGDDRQQGIRPLTPADMHALAELPYIDAVIPNVSSTVRLRYRNLDFSANASGSTQDYLRARGLKIAQGVSFQEGEVRRQAQVVVIDHKTRRKLFPHLDNPLGQVVLIDSLPCTVIGVLEEKETAFGDSSTLKVWLPYTTANARLFGRQDFAGLTVKVKDGQSMKAVEKAIADLLERRHGGKDFFIQNLDSIIKTVENTGRSLTLMLSAIAVISLVVGGIGVMNIMLVSVTERTREIGIRMAVGARQVDVLQQFLTEAVMVCLIGGLIGIALSYGIAFVFSLFVSKWEMVFSVASILAAFFCASLTGIVFGYLPARNAARLDPIDALARE